MLRVIHDVIHVYLVICFFFSFFFNRSILYMLEMINFHSAFHGVYKTLISQVNLKFKILANACLTIIIIIILKNTNSPFLQCFTVTVSMRYGNYYRCHQEIIRITWLHLGCNEPCAHYCTTYQTIKL